MGAPRLRFEGANPSQPVLDSAAQLLESGGADRMVLHHGCIENAPAGPFDGAMYLLTC